jgi:hypothetical protein
MKQLVDAGLDAGEAQSFDEDDVAGLAPDGLAFELGVPGVEGHPGNQPNAHVYEWRYPGHRKKLRLRQDLAKQGDDISGRCRAN